MRPPELASLYSASNFPGMRAIVNQRAAHCQFEWGRELLRLAQRRANFSPM